MFFIKLLSKLPIGILYLIMDTLFMFIYHVIGYRKEVVLMNLKNSFPNKSEKEIKKIRKDFYNRFCEYMAETIKAYSITERELIKRVKFLNVPTVQQYADNKQSIILAGSHQFNWEWALLTGCLVLPFPVDAVYKRLSNKAFDQFMLDTRSKFGGQPIEKSKILRSLINSKERTKAVAIIADQTPKKGDVKYWTSFMNQETAFFTGIEQIAAALKYPVFFYRMLRVKRGYYTVELVKLAEPPYDKGGHDILEAYAKHTQQLIEDDPAGYLWAHKRWKLKNDNSFRLFD